jgi:hypothetical protein
MVLEGLSSITAGGQQPSALRKFQSKTYLSESFALAAVVFFRLGVGILHSMEKATQLVHGTPKLAASQRT